MTTRRKPNRLPTIGPMDGDLRDVAEAARRAAAWAKRAWGKQREATRGAGRSGGTAARPHHLDPLPATGQVHRTEIDGIPTFWVDRPGPMTASLAFRVGM